ncbi:MAG: tripartite tricarboxylate transporter substrate binding protein [Betaproteobacteria bacterium]|nr:tripartite tricarboxylate transporter substrate binding protein [Betaproteobacteria bacterium]
MSRLPSRLPLAAALVLSFAGAALAQDYPAKPVRMIGPSSPGGGIDTNGRILAAAFTQSMGQQFVLENRPGAGGRIGTELVSKAAPDGYTLLFSAAAAMTIHPNTYKNLPYDPVRDFAPISLVALSEYILAVHPSLPVKSVKDLIALAKARPGQIVYGSSGTFGLPHLGGELLEQAAGVDMLHVAYKGGGPAARAILGGEVAFMFGTGPTVVPLAKAGRLRLIAIASNKRSPALPELPTVAETVPGVEVSAWYGLLAPAGTPQQIITRLHAETVKAIADPKVAAAIRNAGGEPVTSTPAEFAAHIKSEIARWGKAVKAANLPIQ